jgi:hypothetical protein
MNGAIINSLPNTQAITWLDRTTKLYLNRS